MSSDQRKKYIQDQRKKHGKGGSGSSSGKIKEGDALPKDVWEVLPAKYRQAIVDERRKINGTTREANTTQVTPAAGDNQQSNQDSSGDSQPSTPPSTNTQRTVTMSKIEEPKPEILALSFV